MNESTNSITPKTQIINTCPTCKLDRTQLLHDLNAPFIWVNWPTGHGGFLGKSDATIKAEEDICKCQDCMVWLYERRG